MKKLIAVAVFSVLMVGCGGSSDAPNGEACELDDDCESDLCVTETSDMILNLPDGLCTNECDIFEQTGCAEFEVCLWWPPTREQWCFSECSKSNPCREGWSCDAFYDDDFNLNTVCVPSNEAKTSAASYNFRSWTN